jgi:hypothetical protein
MLSLEIMKNLMSQYKMLQELRQVKNKLKRLCMLLPVPAHYGCVGMLYSADKALDIFLKLEMQCIPSQCLNND